MVIKRIVCGISLFILGVACSKQQSRDLPAHIKDLENLTVYSAETEPVYHLQLERGQTFGDTDKVLIGQLTAVTVDEVGRVYIADGQQLNIKVYEPDGRFLTLLGRHGQGPREFSELSNLQIKKNMLFAYDYTQQRAIVFLLDSLTNDYTVNFASNRDHFKELSDGFLSRCYVRKKGTFLVKFTKSNLSGNMKDWDKIENTGLYYLLNEDGKIMSKEPIEMKSSIHVLIPYGGRRVGTPVKFYGKSLTTLSDDDHIYMAWSDDFLIKVYDPKGKYQRAFYYPYENAPFTKQSASEAGIPEPLLKGMPSKEFPQTWPVLNNLLIDDQNRLWVSTIVDDQTVHQWWVLTTKGKLLARFTWPRNRRIEVVKNGKLYALQTDKKTGFQQIVRYRVEMN